MRIIDFLTKVAGVPADVLLAVLNVIIDSDMDLAPKAREIRDKFLAPLTAANIAAVAAVIPKEFLDILAAHIDPRDHPSDAA